MKRTIPALGLLLGSLLLALPALGTSALFVTDAEQAQLSATVVVARVGSTRQSVHPNWNRPLTHTRVDVEEVLWGEAPQSLEIVQYKGVLEGRHHKLAGDPELESGERCVLFLLQDEGKWYLTALDQSKYRILPAESPLGQVLERKVQTALFTREFDGLQRYIPPTPPPLKTVGSMRDMLSKLGKQRESK